MAAHPSTKPRKVNQMKKNAVVIILLLVIAGAVGFVGWQLYEGRLERQEEQRAEQARRQAEQEERDRLQAIRDKYQGRTIRVDYTGDSYYEATVQSVDPVNETLRVVIKEVELRGFLTSQLNPSECSEQKALSYSNEGDVITIPSWCVEVVD